MTVSIILLVMLVTIGCYVDFKKNKQKYPSDITFFFMIILGAIIAAELIAWVK